MTAPQSEGVTAPVLDTCIGFYPTADLAATHAFYVGLLGLTLARDQGKCHIYRAGSGYLGFCHSDEPPEYDRRVVLTLVTDAVDAVYTHLQEAGVACEHPPRHNAAFGIYHFYAAGPQGERVEVQRFLKPLQTKNAED